MTDSLPEYDAAIVGLGPVGAFTALLLAESGLRVAVLERSTEHVVLPRAVAIFRAWRPERFAEVNFTLCHGQGAKTGNFSMPTAHLPRLSGDVLLGPEFQKYPDTTRLKLDRLVPEMADVLGLKSFSIITRRGFGCYSCHLGPSGPMFGN